MGFNTRRQRGESVRRPASTPVKNVFRRSRTLTGSISSQVTAAVEHASQLRSPRLEEHDLRGHRRKLSLLLAIVLFGAIGLAWVVDNTVAFLGPDDQTQVTPKHIEIVESYFGDRPMERLPFMLDMVQLTSYVQARASEIATISINGDDKFMKHVVAISEREPVAQWTLGSDTYYVDAEGVAYLRSGLVTTGLLQVKDESGLPLASQRVASRSTMQFIGRVVSRLQSGSNERVAEVILPAGQLKQIDIVMENRPYRIKLHIDREAAGQAADVLAMINYVDAQGITPQYIDARVEGKAFYRD